MKSKLLRFISDDGSALITVLWGIMFCAILVTILTMTTRQNVQEHILREHKAISFQSVLGAIHQWSYDILQNSSGNDQSTMSSKSYEINNFKVSITPRNEEHYLNINQADQLSLEAMIQWVLTENPELFTGYSARALAEIIIDWRDENITPFPQGAEAVDYKQAGLEIFPSNKTIMSLGEMYNMMGFTEKLAEILKKYLTPFGGVDSSDQGKGETFDKIKKIKEEIYYKRTAQKYNNSAHQPLMFGNQGISAKPIIILVEAANKEGFTQYWQVVLRLTTNVNQPILIHDIRRISKA